MNKNKLLASLLLMTLISAQGAPLTALASEAESSSTENVQTSESSDEKDKKSSTEDSSSEEEAETETAAEETKPASEDGDSGETAESSTEESETKPSEETEPSSSAETKPETSPSAAQPAGTPENPSAASASAAKPAAAQPIAPAAGLPASKPSETGSSAQTSGLAALFGVSDISAPSVIASTYVDHWSGSDAYSHHLLARRYGITAEQLDGFLKSTGIAYDSERVNGKKLLEWEKKSGLDVRAIVAIAIAESSLGTAGVATKDGANMFGYGAFDSNPDNATRYSDEVAIQRLTAETIIQNRNTSFQIQDQKAQNLALGQLKTQDGGVYYTDASGTGKRRSQIMENLDKWIDEHGGTPEVPAELRNLSTASIAAVPAGYSTSTAHNTAAYIAVTYPWGECTWYVYNRAQELGYSFGPYMGNGGDWKAAAGYELSDTPKAGYAVSFSPGQAGADGTYGHVAIVEQVKEDGSILISESNALGRGVVSYRTFTAEQAKQLTYVVGKQTKTDKAD